MAFRFPFSTLHELNLDWILEKVKKFAELIPPMEEAVENVQEALEDATDAKEKAEQAVEDANEAVATAEEAKEIAEQAAQGTIADGAVTTVKIADNAVTFGKLATAVQDRITAVEQLNNHVLYPTGDETDRSADIAAKLAAYGCCEFADGEFYIADTVFLPGNSTIRGCGRNAIIKRTSDSVVNTMFAVKDNNGSITIENLFIQCTNLSKPATFNDTGGEVGLLLRDNAHRVIIDNVTFRGMTGAGIRGASGYTYCVSLDMTNCNFLWCNIGVDMLVYGEYANITNCNFIECYEGTRVVGGNNKFVNCGFEKNVNGFVLTDDQYNDSNDGHGSAVSCSFNHNTGYAIIAEYIARGYIFESCNILHGDIYIGHSSGIKVSNCILLGHRDSSAHTDFVLSNNNTGLVSITGCVALNAFTVTKTGTNSNVFVKDNKTTTGVVVSAEDKLNQWGSVTGTSAAANNYSDTTVTFPVAFPSAPYVMITPKIDAATESLETGKIQFFVTSITTTGFTIRTFNNATIARSAYFNWHAALQE